MKARRAAVGAALLLMPLQAAEARQNPMIYFDPGSHKPKLGLALDHSFSWLRRCKVTRLLLIGFADRVGPADYNLRLSRRRAAAVKAELVRHGFPPNSIDIEGRGEAGAIVETPDEVAELANRLVYFEVTEMGVPNCEADISKHKPVEKPESWVRLP